MFYITSIYLQAVFAVLKNNSICKEMQPSEERISQKDMDTTDTLEQLHMGMEIQSSLNTKQVRQRVMEDEEIPWKRHSGRNPEQ